MTDYVIDTIEHEGKKAEIRYDDCAESPRTSCDNLWTLVSNHRDWSDDEGAELSLQDLMERRKTLERDYVIVNVYAYIHSGVALSLNPYGDSWDSGIGFVAYVSKKALCKEYGTKIATAKVKETALSVLAGEVEEYGKWMNGECYMVEVTDEDGVTEDACYGFIGLDAATEYAEEVLGVTKAV